MIFPEEGSYETFTVNSIGKTDPSALIIGNFPSTAPLSASFAFLNACAGSFFIISSNCFFVFFGRTSSIILSTCSFAKSVALSTTNPEMT